MVAPLLALTITAVLGVYADTGGRGDVALRGAVLPSPSATSDAPGWDVEMRRLWAEAERSADKGLEDATGTPVGLDPGLPAATDGADDAEPPPPAAPTAAPVVPVAYGVLITGDPLAEIICQVWGADCVTGVRIAHCESGPTDFSVPVSGSMARNGSVYGLFQLHSIHSTRWSDFWEKWGDPRWNATKAYELFNEQGLNPWIASYACWSW